MKTTTRRLLAGLAFILAVTITATSIDLVRDGNAQPAPTMVPQATQTVSRTSDTPDPSVVSALSAAFRHAAQSTLPAVVAIDVESDGRAMAQAPPRLPFGFGFDDPGPRGPAHSYGTGFVFRPDGYILTNNHVVEDGSRVTVRFQDRREAEATVVGRDPNTDIAVIKVDLDKLAAVDLGNSDDTRVGDWVVALGFPLNLQGTATVTAGIVSAMGRSLDLLRRNGEAAAPLEHYIQTDAAINPGNSGGPLIGLNGSVVGVNSAIASPTGYFSGYGFAIPINIAKRVADDLIRYGEVRRPQLGVGVSDVTEDDKAALHLPDLSGAMVSELTPGKPAEKAGIELGDVIVAIDGRHITDAGQLTEFLANQYDPGDRIRIGINRHGDMKTFDVKLDTFAPAVSTSEPAHAPRERGVSRLGFRAMDVTPQIAQQLNLDGATGVVITDIDPNGPAAGRLGSNILIAEINGHKVSSVSDLEKIANGLDTGDVVSMIVVLPPAGDGSAARRTIVNYRLR